VEALRAEMGRLAEQVAAEQELLGRLEITRQTVVEVVADAGPLRARQVCQALGLGAEAKRREGCGSSPERLVGRGWLVEVSPGLFACAQGVAGIRNTSRRKTPTTRS
jgi:hypothetical protein